jgi:colicin import membrane protein
MRFVMLSILLASSEAFTVRAMRMPTTLRCSIAMVESYYDKQVVSEAAAANPPPGLSPEQAADNPELAKKIASEQDNLASLRARLDAFPKKEGTMYFITKEKVEISDNLIAGYMKNAMTAEERAEVERIENEKKAAAEAEKKAAAEAKKAAAAAAAATKKAEAEAAAAKRKVEAEEKKAKAKVAAEAKKAATAEAAAAKKAKADEAKKQKADEAAAKKVAAAAAPEASAAEAGAEEPAKKAPEKKKGFELPNPFAKKK